MAPIIMCKACCWIKIRGLFNSPLTAKGINQTLGCPLIGVMCEEWTSLGDFFCSHSWLGHSRVHLWQMQVHVWDREWSLGYQIQSREHRRNSGFLIKFLSFFPLPGEDLILLILKQNSNSHQVQWYQTFQNRDTIYLKHQAGNNKRRNVKIINTNVLGTAVCFCFKANEVRCSQLKASLQ